MVGVVLLAGSSASLAATEMLPAGPPPPPGPVKSIPAQFSCDFSGYGYQTGNQPVTMDVSIGTRTTAVAGTVVPVVMTTTAVQLPSPVSSQLTNIADVEVQAKGWVEGATTSTFTATGGTVPEILPSPLTQIPPINTASAQVTFAKAGTAEVDAPPMSVVFTPYGTGSTTYPPITCTPIAPAITNIQVTVSGPPPTATTGPVYACANGSVGVGGSPYTGHVPMTITATGHRSAGSTDVVTLTSPSTGLGAPYPAGTALLTYAGDLEVRGAQSGAVALSRSTAHLTPATFSVSGKLTLTKPGTDRILFPQRFTFDVSNKSGLNIVSLSCASKASPPSAGLTLTVTRKAAGSTAGQGTATGQGTPAGAPDTGGGPRPGISLPLAGGAAALLLAGGGFLVMARKRRGQERAS